METPSTWYEEGLGFENTVLSDIPEFNNFAGDLSFLDQDDDTPIVELRTSIPIVLVNFIFYRFRGTPEVGMPEFETLPIRTRTVAQVLQGQSLVTSISEETGDLNLNTIIDGKNRKICARMFLKTLRLRCSDSPSVRSSKKYTL